MKEYGKYIISDPRVCRGKLVFRDTEIPVEEVLNQVADGMSWEDIIEDHHTRIIVESIEIFCGCSFPSCKYSGPRLKKDNTPYKSGEIDTIHQINLEVIHD